MAMLARASRITTLRGHGRFHRHQVFTAKQLYSTSLAQNEGHQSSEQPDIEQQRTRTKDRLDAIKTAKPFSAFLTDTFQRQHDYLRISITEKCNLRCLYCMPEEGVSQSPVPDLLTSPEIYLLSSIFVSQGVTKIRLTGGEPTIRRDILPLMHQIGSLRSQGLRELCLTTNGITLHRKLDSMVEAGLTGVNLSLDTLDPWQFQIMTRRKGFEAVMKSIDRILEMNRLGAGIKLKINCVVMRGLNEKEILPFVELGREQDLEVRFIEYMPFDGNKWSEGKMLPFKEMLDIIRAEYPDLEKVQDHKNDTSKTYRVPGFVGRLGFITSMTHNFCGSCNRLRITSDGNLKVCLFGNAEVSLRDIIRRSNDGIPIDEVAMMRIKSASEKAFSGTSTPLQCNNHDQELLNVIGLAVSNKKEKHAGVGALENMKNRPMILIDNVALKQPSMGAAVSSFQPSRNVPWQKIPTHLLLSHLPLRHMRLCSSDSLRQRSLYTIIEGRKGSCERAKRLQQFSTSDPLRHHSTRLCSISKTSSLIRGGTTKLVRRTHAHLSASHSASFTSHHPYATEATSWSSTSYTPSSDDQIETLKHVGFESRDDLSVTPASDFKLSKSSSEYARVLSIYTKQVETLVACKRNLRECLLDVRYFQRQNTAKDQELSEALRSAWAAVRPNEIWLRTQMKRETADAFIFRASPPKWKSIPLAKTNIPPRDRAVDPFVARQNEAPKHQSTAFGSSTSRSISGAAKLQANGNSESHIDNMARPEVQLNSKGRLNFSVKSSGAQSILLDTTSLVSQEKGSHESGKPRNSIKQEQRKSTSVSHSQNAGNLGSNVIQSAVKMGQGTNTSPDNIAILGTNLRSSEATIDNASRGLIRKHFSRTSTLEYHRPLLNVHSLETERPKAIAFVQTKSKAPSRLRFTNDAGIGEVLIEKKRNIPVHLGDIKSEQTQKSSINNFDSKPALLSVCTKLEDENKRVAFKKPVIPPPTWGKAFQTATWRQVFQTAKGKISGLVGIQAKGPTSPVSSKEVIPQQEHCHSINFYTASTKRLKYKRATKRQEIRILKRTLKSTFEHTSPGNMATVSPNNLNKQDNRVPDTLQSPSVIPDSLAGDNAMHVRRCQVKLLGPLVRPVHTALRTKSNNRALYTASSSYGDSASPKLTHISPSGSARMVSITDKHITSRKAIAVCSVKFSNADPLPLLRSNQMKKGDVLGVARIAGIMAAKRTSELIPLCHPIAISQVTVELEIVDSPTIKNKEVNKRGVTSLPWAGTGQGDAYAFHKAAGPDEVIENFGSVEITSTVYCDGKTGVEMEALTAASTAALTVYDMCKAVDKGMQIGGLKVIRKEGGKSGTWAEDV